MLSEDDNIESNIVSGIQNLVVLFNIDSVERNVLEIQQKGNIRSCLFPTWMRNWIAAGAHMYWDNLRVVVPEFQRRRARDGAGG